LAKFVVEMEKPGMTGKATDLRNRILVVDDEQSILFAVKDYFESKGLQVDTARELGEATAFLGVNRYSVAIVDLRLSRSDLSEGMTLVSTIREVSPETRILVLTAYGSTGSERRALATGVDAFLRKPKPLAELAQIVFGWLDGPGEQSARAVIEWGADEL
jgi:DNA-binding response OmpR family regulator